MPATPTPASAVNKLLPHAEAFYQRHQADRAVRLTFGYFTHHLVAPLNKKRLRLILDAVNQESTRLGRPLRVLDLACGGGLITSAIASLGHRVIGLDLSQDEIRMAQLFTSEEKLNGMFLQADLLKDTLWEKQVEQTLGGKPDVVTLAYALHHLPDVEIFVERLAGWLNSGSMLLINEENPDSPLFRLKHVVRTWIQHDTEVEWHRSFEAWKSLLQGSGFLVPQPPLGADLIPALHRVSPKKCWSLVFTAQRG